MSYRLPGERRHDHRALGAGPGGLRAYKASYLPHDLAAGLTLGAVMVPVGLAYGELAGLPLAGLYGSVLPLVAYALFGSSRQSIVGPDSAMAALVAVAVVPLAHGRSGPAGGAGGAALGVMVGVLCLLGGRAAAGLRRQLPVQAGDRGLHARPGAGDRRLPASQGAGPPAEGETTLEQFAEHPASSRRHQSRRLGDRCGKLRRDPAVPPLRAAPAGRRLALVGSRLWPWCCSASTSTASPWSAASRPACRRSAPLRRSPTSMTFCRSRWWRRCSPSPTPSSRPAPSPRAADERIDANQELLAIGVANLVSGVTQGLPISASNSRTAVAEAAGGRTQVTSVVAATVVAVVMLWLAGLPLLSAHGGAGRRADRLGRGLCDFGEFAACGASAASVWPARW